jgi:peptidoglycan/xylan/chitin deacetylase (PgdA/CDA1 family)
VATGDALIPRLPRPPAVLCYHAVNEVVDGDDPRRIVTSPRLLEAHVSYLVRRGYEVSTAEQLLVDGAPRRPARGTAVLTFDDGFADALDVVVPILRRHAIRATFYVNPGRFGVQHELVRGVAGRLLDAEGVRTLHAAGMEIGSHAMTHRDLRMLDDSELASELGTSRMLIEQLTGVPCRTLAYPFGLYDERVARATRAAGYEMAFAWVPGPWRRFAAPRLPAPPRHGARRLALKLLCVRRPGRLLVGGARPRLRPSDRPRPATGSSERGAPRRGGV